MRVRVANLGIFFASRTLWGLRRAGSAVIRPVLRYIDRYAQKGLPPKEWEAPKYRYWRDGQELTNGGGKW